ncbi:MAG: hypothetical protein MJ247_04395 [Alphaproteobacteria bacterium]|nr:hypothetical protein [Alphaproteobacteria bacterium]
MTISKKFKKNLLAFTMLTGIAMMLPVEGQCAVKGFNKAETKISPADPNYVQYKEFNAIKAEIDKAVSIHKTIQSFPELRKSIDKHMSEIEYYNRLDLALKNNNSCNANLFKGVFSNGEEVWKNTSDYAYSIYKDILGEAANYLDSDSNESKQKLISLETKLAGVVNQKEMTALRANSLVESSKVTTSSEVDEDSVEATTFQTEAEIDAHTASTSDSINKNKDAVEKESQAQSGEDADMSDAKAYAKLKWDVGYYILRDLYANTKNYGTPSKKFQPWNDQKRVYDAYLKEKYKEMRTQLLGTMSNRASGSATGGIPLLSNRQKLANAFADMAEPRVDEKMGGSYLPADNYVGKEDINLAHEHADFTSGKTADERWCGKGLSCTRVNSGRLYEMHQAYVAAIVGLDLIKNNTKALAIVQKSEFLKAPYLPSAPLPPMYESLYIGGVNQEVPEILSDVPEPWVKMLGYMNIDSNEYGFNGLFENTNFSAMVEQKGKSVRYRPKSYDLSKEDDVITKDKKGKPNLPIPLLENRYSNNIALRESIEQQLPIKENAEQSLEEMNLNTVQSLLKVDYEVSKDLALQKSGVLEKLKTDLVKLEKEKINSARKMIKDYKAKYGKSIFGSIDKNLVKEDLLMQGLELDKDHYVPVNRELIEKSNVKDEINTAVADAKAQELVEAEAKEKDEGREVKVGCPVVVDWTNSNKITPQ